MDAKYVKIANIKRKRERREAEKTIKQDGTR
jgi:hypothetical protein